MTWQTICRPGYFGRHRDERQREYDKAYGQGGWRLAWSIGDRQLERAEAVLIYEDAYFVFLYGRPDVAARLAREAADVFDDGPLNIYSGLDYGIQQSQRTHLQDIAIRRVLVRLGLEWGGNKLIQIRDAAALPPVHELSLVLSPGRVPFHQVDLILRPEIEGWWQPGSVESWYQSNKLLQVQEQKGAA